jgi:hypothetical protein
MKRFIDVTKETREFIAKVFNVTERMVLYALCYDERNGHSDTAKRIRNLAMQKGGIVYVTAPECETIHDADGYMRQYFGNGVMLECNKESGKVTMFVDGEAKCFWRNPNISEYCHIQEYAQKAIVKEGVIINMEIVPYDYVAI